MSDFLHAISPRAVAREVGVIAAAALVYFGVRGSTEDKVGRAFENADWLSRLERELGIAWEQGLQDLILYHSWLVTVTNWVYVYGHWPVIAAPTASTATIVSFSVGMQAAVTTLNLVLGLTAAMLMLRTLRPVGALRALRQ